MLTKTGWMDGWMDWHQYTDDQQQQSMMNIL